MKMMYGFLAVLLFAGLAQSAQAATLYDNFDDGNANGWIVAPPVPGAPLGNWRVENQQVINDYNGDDMNFLLNNFSLSNQTVQSRIYFGGGYAGITLWHRNDNNWVHVYLYPAYANSLWINEFVDGIWTSHTYTFPSNYRTWYTLRVDANSTSGQLAIYVNDTYVLTHTVATPYRTGLSGFTNGNTGGNFDDFRVTSDDLPLTITIEPGNSANTINVKAKTVSVALLSSSNFSPLEQVDTNTLTFGATGDESSFSSCLRKPKDVSGDGLADLVCSFSTKLTGLRCSDTKGVLKGSMKTGIGFESSQLVSVTPCK